MLICSILVLQSVKPAPACRIATDTAGHAGHVSLHSFVACRFKAELGKSNFLEQDNLSIVKHLLLRAEKQLDWSKIVLSCLLVSHLL